MNLPAILFGCIALFCGFTLEHLPMPEILGWFQPMWVLLMVTLMVLQSPGFYGLWLALPVGLLADTEMGALLGTHVLTLTVHILLLQKLFKRFESFNLFQQMALIMVLGVGHQLVRYWSDRVMLDYSHAIDLWGPPLVSALVWPWLATLAHLLARRLSL